MTWVAWRQQRTESLLGVALLALVAALFIPTGIHMASAYSHDDIAACVGKPSFGCMQTVSSFQLRFGDLEMLSGWLNLLPGLIGVMLAAPFALQLEHGTYRLDWTQSVTRRRWILTKLGLVISAALVFSAVYVGLARWWRTPLVHVQGRMEQNPFDQGVVVFGYTLFALGLALAIGVLWRRVVGALIVSFVGYLVARIFFDNWLRQRLIAPKSVVWEARKTQPAFLNRAWVVAQGPSDKSGHPLGRALCFHPSSNTQACVVRGPHYMYALYEPASRYWSLQLLELGLFAGVAVVLIALAGWWTSTRTA